MSLIYKILQLLKFLYFRELQGVSCDKIVVVSVVGKTAYQSQGLKVKSIGRVSPLKNILDEEVSIL